MPEIWTELEIVEEPTVSQFFIVSYHYNHKAETPRFVRNPLHAPHVTTDLQNAYRFVTSEAASKCVLIMPVPLAWTVEVVRFENGRVVALNSEPVE